VQTVVQYLNLSKTFNWIKFKFSSFLTENAFHPLFEDQLLNVLQGNSADHPLYRYLCARRMSKDVPADAAFLCDKGVVYRATLKETSSFLF
jgi:hypothetical protein